MVHAEIILEHVLSAVPWCALTPACDVNRCSAIQPIYSWIQVTISDASDLISYLISYLIISCFQS